MMVAGRVCGYGCIRFTEIVTEGVVAIVANELCKVVSVKRNTSF